ncbi:MAG: hypothetical protein Ta2D_02980 [Rickettsiales bacterium]|nr:MAG: hypothetical protein Ta2D_02980 [Rickettsiales bacterium]
MADLLFYTGKDENERISNNKAFFKDTLSKINSSSKGYKKREIKEEQNHLIDRKNLVHINEREDGLTFTYNSYNDGYNEIKISKSGELKVYTAERLILDTTEKNRIIDEFKRRFKECASIGKNSVLGEGGLAKYILALNILENPKLIKEISINPSYVVTNKKTSLNESILDLIVSDASASTIDFYSSDYKHGHAVSLLINRETKEITIVDSSGAIFQNNFGNNDSFLFDINKDGKKEFYTLKALSADCQKEGTCYLQSATISTLVAKRVQNRKNKLAVLENMKKNANNPDKLRKIEKNIIIAKERLAEAAEFPINSYTCIKPHFLNRDKERINLLKERREKYGDNDNEIQKEIDRVNRQTKERLDLYAKYLQTKNISILNSDGTINLSKAEDQLDNDYELRTVINERIVAKELGNRIGKDHAKKHNALTEYVIYTKDSKNKPARFSYFSPTANKQPTLDDFKKLYRNLITYDSKNPPKIIQNAFLVDKFSEFYKGRVIKYEGIDEDKILKNLVNSRQEDAVRGLKTIPNELPSKKYIEEETNLVRQQQVSNQSMSREEQQRFCRNFQLEQQRLIKEQWGNSLSKQKLSNLREQQNQQFTKNLKKETITNYSRNI